MITLPKVISLGFLSVGIFVLMQVILPLVYFQFWSIGQNYNNKVLTSPKTPQSNILGVSIEKGISVEIKDNFPAFISDNKRESDPIYSEFSLTIPKINFKETLVYVDSNDLSKALAHLPGTALPGEKGNVFISGHSAVSRFWEKNAFFAKLSDLKVGDEIEVEASGSRFTYKIMSIKSINPTDLSVIAPPDEGGRYITLMTCVPPGLNFKRLIVLGKML